MVRSWHHMNSLGGAGVAAVGLLSLLWAGCGNGSLRLGDDGPAEIDQGSRTDVAGSDSQTDVAVDQRTEADAGDGGGDVQADAAAEADAGAGDGGGDAQQDTAAQDAAPDAEPPKQPNILFIAIDDLNDWVTGLGGHPQSHTPNIERLAARGMMFTHAYTAAPACNPSRVATLTGLRPSTSGIYRNPQPWRPVLPNAVTLPQYFRKHGYHVMGSGKIFHSKYQDPPSWDEYWPSKCKPRPADPMPDGRPLNGIPNTAHFDWGPVPVSDDAMADTKVVDWVINKLGAKHDKPFFLACGIFRPHLPWYVPPAYFDKYPLASVQLPQFKEDDLDDVPAMGQEMARTTDHSNVRAYGQWHEAVQGYLASIRYADAQVGRVLDALLASAHANNTIVVLWTDHGWHLGQKKHWRKFALWEEATHVPLIIATPGVTPGSRTTRPVNLVDLYPTLADLAGLPKPTGLDGRSLKPLLMDPKASWSQPSLTTYKRNNHALRDERWRYIRYADGTEELYDHQKDPFEWTNIAAKPVHDAVKKRLSKWLPKVNVPEAPDESKYDPNQIKCSEGG